MKKYIDISVTLKSGMAHWPGDPDVKIHRVKDMNKGAGNNLSQLSMSAHAGTHMDAPLHFIRAGKSLDKMPLEATVGPARVISIKDKKAITVAELKGKRIRAGERVLFKTLNSSRCWKGNMFKKNFVYITPDAAQYLADRKVQTVGVDYLSVGGFYEGGRETHLAFLNAGIWLIEGLDLSKAKEGKYQLICLPLKILNSDGAPARAVLVS